MTVTRRWLVAGRVQGVGFRAFVVEVARRTGVGGYVRNLADGRVEVVATGPGDAMRRVERELRDGPPLAEVERLRGDDAEPADLPVTFEIRRTEDQGYAWKRSRR